MPEIVKQCLRGHPRTENNITKKSDATAEELLKVLAYMKGTNA